MIDSHLTRPVSPTVTDPGDLDFVVKYATDAAPDTDILEDIIAGTDPFTFPTAGEPQIGYQKGDDPLAATYPPSGWVFYPTSVADERPTCQPERRICRNPRLRGQSKE